MENNKSSMTALAVARLRAAHQLIDGMPKVLKDQIIVRLMGEEFAEHITGHPDAFRDPVNVKLRAHVLLRSRFAEDRLGRAYSRGVRQYLLLGAGLDTFAWRQAEGLEALRIYEVDHPATQGDKRRLLAGAGFGEPANLRFIPIDFETTSLAAGLEGSDFRPKDPVFISWLGVTVYLTMEAIDAVFEWLRGCAAGSEMVFTFTQRRAFNPLAARAAQIGEPWHTYFTPGELTDKLRGFGFSTIEILDPREASRTYFSGRNDALAGPDHASIARVIV